MVVVVVVGVVVMVVVVVVVGGSSSVGHPGRSRRGDGDVVVLPRCHVSGEPRPKVVGASVAIKVGIGTYRFAVF